ncbi:Na+/H+ antiporter NhaC family protein [uncultured Campylobacter sp.]|uniref:Na+/H+ antiporter NhaC family protein n=1 Tax=uncultured Campylobacter sp. TaxID=218934 RepID=UPI00261DE2CB|nr:Na+/H+ antiporter NhaC family protein [uncultured Campylobacter sp.]
MKRLLFILFLPVFAIAAGDPTVAQMNAKTFGLLTLLPPVVAIGLAFLTKDVILSLFIGAFTGSYMLALTTNNWYSAFVSGFAGFIKKAVNSLGDPGNAGIVLQVLCIGGVVALITKSGGTKAIAQWLSKKAKSYKSSQFSTWIMGLIIFFDDYANSLIVGPIMRPVIDKFRVSREKLAFIMDSTAAPITGIAIISTWIGLEISVIKSGYGLIPNDYYQFLSLDPQNVNAFGIFLETIPYRFYNIFMLLFVIMTIFMGREFGPMYKAEKLAREGKRFYTQEAESEIANLEDKLLEPKESVKPEAINALVPLFVLIIGSFIGFYYSGLAELDPDIVAIINKEPLSFFALRETFGAADASIVLFQAALASAIVAIILGVYKKIFKVREAIVIWTHGWRIMIVTVIILVSAWTLSSTIKELGTSVYLVEVFSNTISYIILPALIFILASIISFSTGTSYGTMGILMPLVIPLAVAVGVNSGKFVTPDELHCFMVICISGVLTGAIFGDHCSPISDTTILSSMGSGCNHISHVQTQIPYALSICVISLFFGYIPVTLGLNIWVTLLFGVGMSALMLRVFGKKVD